MGNKKKQRKPPPSVKGWRLSWAGHSFTDRDLTIGDIAAAQVLTGQGWASADPMQGPYHAANIIAVVVGRIEGRDPLVVLAEIGKRPAVELIDALGPPDEAPPLTAVG